MNPLASIWEAADETIYLKWINNEKKKVMVWPTLPSW